MSSKRVILLGDSIRLSYQEEVQRLLLGHDLTVSGPADNCRFSLYTLMRLADWLPADEEVDTIHWNNGLWDLGNCTRRAPTYFQVDEYLVNLGFIAEELQKKARRVIWRTITPVREPQTIVGTWTFSNERIEEYNRRSVELMCKLGIGVHDLWHDFHHAGPDWYVADGVHLSPLGVTRCAASVSAAIIAGSAP